jgi:mono/diheme cytochrome c family protein
MSNFANIQRWFVGTLALGIILVAVLAQSSCAASSSPASPAQNTTQLPTTSVTSPLSSTNTASPISSAPVVTASRSAPSTSAVAPSVISSPLAAGDLLTRGEDLYQRTAGGMGCAACHGTDAYGNIGPNIRSSSAQEIQDALQNVAAMKFLKLNDDDVNAIAAYLTKLGSQ